MDYYNFNPDFEDSLAFLSPVAQRNTGLSNRVLIPEFIRAEDVQYMRNPFSIDQRYQRPLSKTPLSQDKAKNREIIEQYCAEHIRYLPYPYPKLNKPVQISKHRPLIRVTVIPNNSTWTKTKLRKRRPCAKKIQTTASNHDSFLKAKNVFLFVASNNREKINEIKTTGSAYDSGNRYAKNEHIPVEQNFKQLLRSLDMDKKKKKKDKVKGKKSKDKKKEEDNPDEESVTSLMDVMANAESPKASLLRECICPPPIDTVSPRKSRVRITGKIGLTEDDRYVMKCAATIDGKPVETSYFQGQNIGRSSPIEWENQETREIPRVCMPSLSIGQRENNTSIQREIPKVCQRDEMVQCNCDQDLAPANTQYCDRYRQTYPCPAYKEISPTFRSVETQYSLQNVNAMCFSNIEKVKIFSSRDEVVQCDCPQDLIMNTNNIGFDVDYDKKCNSPSSCNNPLVIISVYPKQDTKDTFYEEENSVKERRESLPPQKEKAKAKKDKKDEREDKKKGKGSRSPSPAKGKENKKADKLKGKGKGKDKDDKDKPAKGNKKGGKKEKQSHDEKKSSGSKSPEERPSGTQFGITVGRCAECCMGCAGSESKRRPDIPQGAPQFRTKRMMNWVSAKSDVSNVAINIDGENEFYDVLFRQGNITTDLQVRKTLKEAQAYRNRFEHGSLENFYPGSDDTGRKSNDLPIADNTETLDPTIPRLNVRDSIEISHRREEKNGSNSVTTNASSSSTDASHINLGNTKHFKGDNCKLPNPVERDKEIRELLGVDKPRTSPSGNYQESSAKAEMDCKSSVRCIYRRQRKPNINNIQSNNELKWWLSMNDAVTQASNDIDDNITKKYHNKDDDYNIECLVCKDTVAPVESNSALVYVCEAGNKFQNKRNIICEEERSVSESKSRSLKLKGCPKFNTPPKSTLAPRSNNIEVMTINSTKYASRRSCGVIVNCADEEKEGEKDDEDEEDEDDLKLEQIKRFEEPSRLSTDEKEKGNKCEPIQPGKVPYTAYPSFQIKKRKPCEKICTFEENQRLCQQLILNRNINIYLQIEQFTKQKPIILSRKQYEKVKRALEYKIPKKSHRISCSRVCGDIIRKYPDKTKTKPDVSNKRTQCACKERVNYHHHYEYNSHEPIKLRCNTSNTSLFPFVKASEKKEYNRKTQTKPLISSTEFDDIECESLRDVIRKNKNYILEVDRNEKVNQIMKHAENINLDNEDNFKVETRKGRKISHDNTKLSNECFLLLDSDQPQQSKETIISSKSKLNDSEKVIKRDRVKKEKDDTLNKKEFIKEATRKTHRKNENKIDHVNKGRDISEKKGFINKLKRGTGREKETIRICAKRVNDETLAEKGFINEPTICARQETESKMDRLNRKGDKTLEEDRFINERSTRREIESENLKNQGSQSVCSEQVDDGGTPKIILPPKCDIRPQYCKNCGRLRVLHSCGICGKLNGTCHHTCNCCNIIEENSESSKKNVFIKDRQYAASSTEVRYTRVIYTNHKHITFSSHNVTNKNTVPAAANLLVKNCNSTSLHTIFKGRRRTPTPNLGTSEYSLYSDYTDATSVRNQELQLLQERKPLLRRLMSLLVMRTKTSNVQINASRPNAKKKTSSVDSYHINTSLEAIEMSSSIFDTSASFYSNHSIQPINSKIAKRGFLTSVREFLSNRRT